MSRLTEIILFKNVIQKNSNIFNLFKFKSPHFCNMTGK